MNQSDKTVRWSKYLMVSGFLIHYAYSLALFLVSRASGEMAPLPEVLYLTGAGVPLIMLCMLALRSREAGKAARGKPEHVPSNAVGSALAFGGEQSPWVDTRGM